MGQKKTPRELLLDEQALIETATTLKKSAPQEVIVTPGLERKEGQRGRYMTKRFQHVLNVFEPENTDTFFQQCRTESSLRRQTVKHSLFAKPATANYVKSDDVRNIDIDKAHTSIKYFEALCHQYDANMLNNKIDIIRSLSELIKKNGKNKTTMRSLFDIIHDSDIKLVDFATRRNLALILFTPVRSFLTPLEKTNLLVNKLTNNAFQKKWFETQCRKHRITSNQYLYSLAERSSESAEIILDKLEGCLSPEYKDAITKLHSNAKDSGSRDQVAGRRP